MIAWLLSAWLILNVFRNLILIKNKQLLLSSLHFSYQNLFYLLDYILFWMFFSNFRWEKFWGNCQFHFCFIFRLQKHLLVDNNIPLMMCPQGHQLYCILVLIPIWNVMILFNPKLETLSPKCFDLVFCAYWINNEG